MNHGWPKEGTPEAQGRLIETALPSPLSSSFLNTLLLQYIDFREA